MSDSSSQPKDLAGRSGAGSDRTSDPPAAESGAAAAPSSQRLQDPGRRQVLRRVGAAAMVAGASTLGAVAFFDAENPVRSKPVTDRTIPDHRVEVPPATPPLVIARGGDPAKNVNAALERLGGLAAFIKKGETVLIKPNVGWDRRPEQAANTNPEVVGRLVQLCRAAGAGKVLVTDCPVNDPERCFARSGILDAVNQAGGRVVLPGESAYQMVRIPGKLGRWPVLAPFIQADKIINVPIVKHHSLTQATVGMKNWYGILGGRRAQLHQRINESVAELAALMRPTLTVVDATRILVRNGPTGGSLSDVKEGQTVAVSLDPVAADAWALTLLEKVEGTPDWLRLGRDRGLGVMDYRSLNPVELTTG